MKSKAEQHAEMRVTRAYRIWRGMVMRGIGMSDSTHYYDRGINVCDRWLDFKNFLADMGPGDTKYSLDRIDVNKGYCPENCRWATGHTQANNKTNTRYVVYKKQRRPVAEVAFEVGVPSGVLLTRIHSRGGSLTKALTVPYESNYSRKNRLKGVPKIPILTILNYWIDFEGSRISEFRLGFFESREFMLATKMLPLRACGYLEHRGVRLRQVARVHEIYLKLNEDCFTVPNIEEIPRQHHYKYWGRQLLPHNLTDLSIYNNAL